MVKRREREDPMYLLAEGGEEERWKTAEDLPGEKTYVDYENEIFRCSNKILYFIKSHSLLSLGV